MSEDLKISTKVIPGIDPMPPQQGATEYFGEQSNDLQFSVINDFATLSGLEKLKQDIKKILLTERGANVNYDIYGSQLQVIVGNKINFDYTRAKIRDEIINALQVLEFINRDNPNQDERPEVLELLSIRQLTVDQFEVQISVITASGKQVSTGLTVTSTT